MLAGRSSSRRRLITTRPVDCAGAGVAGAGVAVIVVTGSVTVAVASGTGIAAADAGATTAGAAGVATTEAAALRALNGGLNRDWPGPATGGALPGRAGKPRIPGADTAVAAGVGVAATASGLTGLPLFICRTGLIGRMGGLVAALGVKAGATGFSKAGLGDDGFAPAVPLASVAPNWSLSFCTSFSLDCNLRELRISTIFKASACFFSRSSFSFCFSSSNLASASVCVIVPGAGVVEVPPSWVFFASISLYWWLVHQ